VEEVEPEEEEEENAAQDIKFSFRVTWPETKKS